GISLAALGDRARPITDFLNNLTAPVFYLVGMLMKLAPIGAFGAMAFTIGKYGVGSLVQLGQLILCFYVTCLLFIFIVLGT
ncbi:cation:dicarboxylase symporter family transporter, partial [Acinetobacter nosocomialis]|uniref:cation:dicarboxylate symporter family transporter n=1 Tax=Acinetobacter nosocomialis TaxID=106654 RepID=UPI0030FC3685